MFRFSRGYNEEKRASFEAIEEARCAIEKEQHLRRRWRRKHPDRDPRALITLWDRNKTATSKEYSDLIVRFMSTFDGVAEANQMLRYGMEAPNAEIPLQAFHDLAFNTFTLRMFEILANQTGLSDQTRALVLQQLVPQVFPNAAPPSKSRSFNAAAVPLE